MSPFTKRRAKHVRLRVAARGRGELGSRGESEPRRRRESTRLGGSNAGGSNSTITPPAHSCVASTGGTAPASTARRNASSESTPSRDAHRASRTPRTNAAPTACASGCVDKTTSESERRTSRSPSRSSSRFSSPSSSHVCSAGGSTCGAGAKKMAPHPTGHVNCPSRLTSTPSTTAVCRFHGASVSNASKSSMCCFLCARMAPLTSAVSIGASCSWR